MKDGYGINEHLIRYAYEEGVDTILTCDNGIAAVEQTKLAKSLGMTILITDHHEVQEEVPPADAVVNQGRQTALIRSSTYAVRPLPIK